MCVCGVDVLNVERLSSFRGSQYVCVVWMY